MKNTIKYFAFVSLIFFGVSTAVAQTTSFGPMLGTNITTLSNIPNAKNTAGLSIGGFFNQSVNEHFGINVKALFSQFGTAYENSTVKNRLNYFQVPVSAVYYLGNSGNRLRPKVFAGLYGASLTNSDENNDNSIVVNGQTDYKSFDAGGQLGLGFNYRVRPRSWLNVEVGYTQGFVGVSEFQGDNLRNQGYNVNVGLSFALIK